MANLSSDEQKRAVGQAAAREIANLSTSSLTPPVGLGTGSTVDWVVRELSDSIKSINPKRTVDVVVTSERTRALCEKLGCFKILDASAAKYTQVYVDGADETERASLDSIKGGGGALTREMLIGGHAPRRIAVIDQGKLVEKIGHKFPVPIEVHSFGVDYLMQFLKNIGADANAQVREGPGGRNSLYGPIITENGLKIVDVVFPESVTVDPNFARELRVIPGVLTVGLFLKFFDEALVSDSDGNVTTLTASRVSQGRA